MQMALATLKFGLGSLSAKMSCTSKEKQDTKIVYHHYHHSHVHVCYSISEQVFVTAAKLFENLNHSRFHLATKKLISGALIGVHV